MRQKFGPGGHHSMTIWCDLSGEDDSDLYLEERDAALRAAQDEKRKVHVTIPGMLNPHEIPEEMQD